MPHRRRSRSRSRSRDRRDQHGASRRHRSYSRSRSPSHRHRRSRSPGRLPQHHGRSRSRSPRRRRSGSRQRGFEEDVNDTVSDAFVRTVAAQVRGNDASYEDNLRERERSNVQYAFLTDDRVRLPPSAFQSEVLHDGYVNPSIANLNTTNHWLIAIHPYGPSLMTMYA